MTPFNGKTESAGAAIDFPAVLAFDEHPLDVVALPEALGILGGRVALETPA